MPNVHLILQGKGGVGKSFAASTLAQYKQSKGESVLCIDTDPVNSTFLGYKALEVTRLNILENDEINSRSFDKLIELIAPLRHDVIVDNGASSFVPLSYYLITNEVPELLESLGHQLVIHTVITGGQALLDTANGFAHLCSQFTSNTSFVVWLNPFWGSIQLEGKEFEEMNVYLSNRDRVTAIVRIPDLKKETYGYDLEEILKSRLTFTEALARKDLTIMTRQRLTIIQRELFSELSKAVVL
jgi:CobQ/CobB/MinD/ParA nucleotide binding domain